MAHLISVPPECRNCGPMAPEKMAVARGQGSLCKACVTRKTRDWAAKNAATFDAQKRRSYLMKKYGITLDEYEAILASQGGVCAICHNPPSDPRGFKMHVDHDHGTGRVRGILCGSCNSGLGQFKDNVRRLASAIVYLQRRSPLNEPQREAPAEQRTFFDAGLPQEPPSTHRGSA